jgi:hypothetical protein
VPTEHRGEGTTLDSSAPPREPRVLGAAPEREDTGAAPDARRVDACMYLAVAPRRMPRGVRFSNFP